MKQTHAQTERARALRQQQTPAEGLLWGQLRGGRLGGSKWRRQTPIGPYFVDFLCPAARLVVEVDGGQHGREVDRDAARTAFLQAQGYRVLRVWNPEVLNRMEEVLQTILAHLRHQAGFAPHPNPSPLQGEGL